MSIRQIRKLYGENTLPPPNDLSDEEYEPFYGKGSPSKFKYAELIMSSHSEDEENIMDQKEADVELTKKKKKKKKKKNKARDISKTCEKENIDELDEIDRSVMEVNALLGKPPTPPPLEEPAPTNVAIPILSVHHKHLHVANEMKKMFGPKAVESEKKEKGSQPRQHKHIHSRKNAIVPLTKIMMNFQRCGLSMSVLRRENDNTYFVFDHNKEYQRMHNIFLQIYHTRAINALHEHINGPQIEEAQKNMHVEALLESADTLFRLEEFTAATTLIEQVIMYMQYVAHPTFDLTDMKTRLEYKYLENRTFHIAVLKYLHLLSNRACHRTALELAKLLLNLDPSDPLAVVFIIDTLALRAREHQWLIDAVDYWSLERDAGFLFNIQYSYAMAKFHIAAKANDETTEADTLLQTAMRRFPYVGKKLLECINLGQNTHLRQHDLFQTISIKLTSHDLKDIINLYVKFVCSKWREPIVTEWVIRNTQDLLNKYDNDPLYQDSTKKLASEQFMLFRGLPQQITRHLCVIKPMDNLLVEGEVPRVPRFRSTDPLPPINGINRYSYDLVTSTTVSSGSPSAFFQLFSSILPNFEPAPRAPQPPQPPPDIEEERLPERMAQMDPNEFIAQGVGDLAEAARPPIAPYQNDASGTSGSEARDVDDIYEAIAHAVDFVIGANEDLTDNAEQEDASEDARRNRRQRRT